MSLFRKIFVSCLTIVVSISLITPPAYSLAPADQEISADALKRYRDYTRPLSLGTHDFPVPPCLSSLQGEPEGHRSVLPKEAPPFPFPNIETDTGIHDPYWLKLYILGIAILETCPFQGSSVSFGELRRRTKEKFKRYRRTFSNREFRRLVNNLRRLNLVKSGNDVDFVFDDNLEITLNVPPRMLAVASDATAFIIEDIKNAIKNGESVSVLKDYAKICEKWPLYPVEANYPVLRAVTKLSKEDQNKIVESIKTVYASGKRPPLVDAVFFVLDPVSAKKEWLKNNAPELEGRRVYSVAAEISLLAGGLGRVMQYHGTGLNKLGADNAYIEPYYEKDKTDGDVNYNGIVNNLHEISETFEISVQGKPVEFTVFSGVVVRKDMEEEDIKIPVYLIKPKNSYYAKKLYTYNGSYITSEEFTEFFAKASLELIKHLELERKREKQANWRAPIIDANDGQIVSISAFAQIFYRNKDKQDIRNSDGTAPSPEDAGNIKEIFDNALFCATTHTYMNRILIHDLDYGREFLRKAGIPEEYWWLFLSRRKNDKGKEELVFDFTSAGLRAADAAKGVAAIHAYEVGKYDPAVDLYGVTNGDNTEYSTEFFRECMREISEEEEKQGRPPLEYGSLTAEQIAKVKRKAKEKLGLDPDQMVVSYSGRLVPEKAGQRRAFTRENIIGMVRDGVQVVIYGNVQPNKQSRDIADALERLEKEIQGLRKENSSEYSGNFIFKKSFSIEDQVKLLAAEDVQIQDSDRGTGASEYTEADVSANGGLQFSPPYWEGIINKQGTAIDWDNLTGNTIVPENDSPESYLKEILHANSLFKDAVKRPDFFKLQAESLKLSRVLRAEITSAAYMRFWNEALRKERVAIRERFLGGIPRATYPNMNVSLGDGSTKVRHLHGEYKVEGHGAVRLEVKADLIATGIFDHQVKRKIDYRLVRVRINDRSGKTISLTLKSVPAEDELQAVFTVDLEDLPIDGYIEVTSGLWWERTKFKVVRVPLKKPFKKRGAKKTDGAATADETLEKLQGNISLRQVVPLAKALNEGGEIAVLEGEPVVFCAEFPCTEVHKDGIVPVVRTNFFSETEGDDRNDIFWDDLSRDQLIVSDLKYDKAKGTMTWTFGFVPEKDMKFTCYVTHRDIPAKEDRIWLSSLPGRDIRIKVNKQAGDEKKRVGVEEVSLGYAKFTGLLNSIFGEIGTVKIGTATVFLSRKTVAVPIFAIFDEVVSADMEEVRGRFTALAKTKDKEEVSALLYLLGKLSEESFAPDISSETRAKVILVLADKLLREWKGLSFVKIALLWKNLSGMGYAKYIGIIIQNLFLLENKKPIDLNPQEQMLLYFIHAFMDEADANKINTYRGVDYVRDISVKYPEWMYIIKDNMLQTQLLKTCRDGKFSGVIVQDLRDYGASVNNWLRALKNFKVDVQGVQMVYLMEGLNPTDRQRLLKLAPQGSLFAEKIEDINASGQNIVYLTRKADAKKDTCKERGIKLVERGKCGPIIELSMALQFINVSKMYEGAGLSEEAFNVYVEFLNQIRSLTSIDDITVNNCKSEVKRLGFIKLPEITRFEKMWEEEMALPVDISA